MNRFTAFAACLVFPIAALAQDDGLPAPAAATTAPAALPTLERLAYERVIEWAGDHVQLRIVIARQPDGSYLVDTGGEDHPEHTGLQASEADLQAVREALHAMREFPDATFAGNGHHWYTSLEAHTRDAQGQPLVLLRWFYDMDDSRLSAQNAALEQACAELIKALAPQALPAQPAGGLAGALAGQ